MVTKTVSNAKTGAFRVLFYTPPRKPHPLTLGQGLKGVKKGVASGAGKELTNVLRKIKGTGTKPVQVVGDMGALAVAKAKRFKPTSFPVRYHGIDAVYEGPGSRLIIVEAKGGSSVLGDTIHGGQMSQDWIEHQIEKLIKKRDDLWASRLRKAQSQGKLQAMVVSTPIDAKGEMLDPVFELKEWAQIGKSSW